MSSISYLPHVSPKNNNTAQIRRRVTDIVSTLNQTVGSISSNSGDIGTLNDELTTANSNIKTIQATLSPGISGTVTLAKLTGGGTNGSLTFAGGIITAVVDPT
jgi:hypothetical protein